mmetsp:Transcript_8471/g.18963  ORF Transcript_8471/g.18963 Transcript_8471/m.18963 type:complete len:121 (-) Transcript_8471:107-469(-)
MAKAVLLLMMLLAGECACLSVDTRQNVSYAAEARWDTTLAPGLEARIVISSASGAKPLRQGPETAEQAVQNLTYQIVNEDLRSAAFQTFLGKHGVNPQAKLVAPQMIADAADWNLQGATR